MKQNAQKSADSNFKKLQTNKWNLILFLMFHPAPSHNVPSHYVQPTHLPGHMTPQSQSDWTLKTTHLPTEDTQTQSQKINENHSIQSSVKILQACTRPMPSCPGEDSGPLGSALPNPAVPSSTCNDWIAYVDSHKHQHNTSTWPATMRIGQWHFQFLVKLRFHPGRSM